MTPLIDDQHLAQLLDDFATPAIGTAPYYLSQEEASFIRTLLQQEQARRQAIQNKDTTQ